MKLGPYGQRPVVHANTTIADGLISGQFRLYRYDPVPFTIPVDWEQNPYDNTWRWALHGFQYLYDLCNLALARNETHGTGLAIALLKDWWDKECRNPHDPYHWKGHTTGLRAQVIAYLYPLCEEIWYEDMMLRHGLELADIGKYEAVHNHGLDQDLGLLALAGCLGRTDWIDIATERTADSAAAMVDRQGVTSEQAVGYTYYVYALLAKIADAIELVGRNAPPSVLNRSAVPTFLAHATQPDGFYAPIGDTPVCRAYNLPGTAAEYAATGGTNGPMPSDDMKMFDGGWIFGRSGWGTARDFGKESFYSLRFGPGVAVHGHADGTSLTYFSDGQPLIIDSGFGGYGDRGFYNFERSPSAHNMVMVDGYGDYLTKRPTLHRATVLSDETYTHDLVGWPYRGVRRRRVVTFFKRLDSLLVFDQVSANHAVTTKQRWHLSPSLKIIDSSPSKLSASSASAALVFRQLFEVGKVSVESGSTDPLAGWHAMGQGERVPTSAVSFVNVGAGSSFLTLITNSRGVGVDHQKETDEWRIYQGDCSYSVRTHDTFGIVVTKR